MPRKVLVIQTAFLGDAILTLPMIQKLKMDDPEVLITVLCIPSTAPLYSNAVGVDELIVYDKHNSEKSLMSYISLISKIRRKKFSEVYSPHRSIRSTLAAYFSGASFTVGFDKADFSFFYKKRVKYFLDRHEVERNLSLLQNFEKESEWKLIPKVDIQDEIVEKINNIAKPLSDKKLIALAPGSVWKTKIYPKEYFIELAKMLASRNYNIVLIGGKEDEFLCNDINNSVGQNINSLAGELSIIESIELLKRCNALISNDSAPTHLGMIADIPVLTIYCSTVPAFGFYPYNNKSRFISLDDLKCKPCGIHGHNECPINTFDCGYKLLPKTVFEKFSEILSA